MSKKTVLFATCVGFVSGHLVTKYGKQFVNYVKNSNNKKPLDEIILDIKNTVHKNVDDSFKCVENFYTEHMNQGCKKDIDLNEVGLDIEKEIKSNYITVPVKDEVNKNPVTVDDLINKAIECNTEVQEPMIDIKDLTNKKDKNDEITENKNVEFEKELKHEKEMTKLRKRQSINKGRKSQKIVKESVDEKKENENMETEKE